MGEFGQVLDGGGEGYSIIDLSCGWDGMGIVVGVSEGGV